MEGQEEETQALLSISKVEEERKNKAGDEARTRNILLGKQALCH
jgi:hypothetical protein